MDHFGEVDFAHQTRPHTRLARAEGAGFFFTPNSPGAEGARFFCVTQYTGLLLRLLLMDNHHPFELYVVMCHVETRKSETLTPTFASKISETKPHTKLAHTPNSPDLGFERSAHQTRLGESGVRCL